MPQHSAIPFISLLQQHPPALLVLVRMLPSIPDSRVGADMRFPPQKLDGFSYVERVWGCGGLVVVATPHGIFLFFAYSMRIHAINQLSQCLLVQYGIYFSRFLIALALRARAISETRKINPILHSHPCDNKYLLDLTQQIYRFLLQNYLRTYFQ